MNELGKKWEVEWIGADEIVNSRLDLMLKEKTNLRIFQMRLERN